MDTQSVKAVSELESIEFDLVIALTNSASKLSKDFSDNTTVIQIEYEEPEYSNSTNIERFIKTIKMELIPITRDILEL